jgi:hypothetical protein
MGTRHGHIHGTRQTQISADDDTSANTEYVQYANEIPMVAALFNAGLSHPLSNLSDKERKQYWVKYTEEMR